MKLQFMILLYLTQFINGHLLKPAKVHEDTNEFYVTRTSRQSDQRYIPSHLYPPKFNFKTARQQDPQRQRYNQQQKLDAVNLPRSPLHIRKERVVVNNSALSDKKRPNSTTHKQIVILPMFDVKLIKPPSLNATKHNYLLHNDEVIEHSTRSSRQLKPSSYEVEEINDLDAQGSENYQGHDFLNNPSSTYVNPKIFNEKIHALSRSDNEGELRALNDLIGKNPDLQLKGLKELLEDPAQLRAILPEMIKGQPFTSSKNAIPVTESADNQEKYTRTIVIHEAPPPDDGTQKQFALGSDTNSLQQLQSQLDASANARVQEALKKAQRDAVKHIQQQHQAIAAAQEQARQAALEKIRKHNEAIAQEYVQEQSSRASDSKVSAQVAQSRIHAYPHGGYINLAQAQSQDNEEEGYTHPLPQSHTEDEYVYTVEPSKAPVEPEYHYVSVKPVAPAPTIVQPTPIYPHISLQNPGVLKIAEDSEKSYGSGEHDELQYASKYAFGYRIRDYHSGNDYGHEEKRDGKRAKGHYHVLLPDGRIQNVDYWADPSGFHAQVTYNNIAHH